MKYIIDESLLGRYFEKALNAEEKQLVENWINQSEENKKLAQQVGRIYFLSNLSKADRDINISRKLEVLSKKITRRRTVLLWRRIGRIAAIFLLPLVLFSLYYLWPSQETKQITEQLVEVRAKAGITNSIILPDSSIVYLNSESILKYPARFAQNRNVYLQGEAYFIVKKQQGARFIVNTSANAKVEVVGTEFNVNAERQEVNATLVKGIVRFICQSDNQKEESIQIRPGQKIIYNNSTRQVQVKEVDVDSEISWRDGKTVFKDCPLMDALQLLSKRFNVDFIVKNNKLKEFTFTGNYKNQGVEQILENFSLSSNIRYKYINKKDNSIHNNTRDTIELY